MRGGRWIYHRQVAVPLVLWIMYSSSFRRKWEIEFTLTSLYSHVHLSSSGHVPLSKPAIRRDQYQCSIKKLMVFLKICFWNNFSLQPPSQAQGQTHTCAHTNINTGNSFWLRHFIPHISQLCQLGWWRMQYYSTCSNFQKILLIFFQYLPLKLQSFHVVYKIKWMWNSIANIQYVINLEQTKTGRSRNVWLQCMASVKNIYNGGNLR